jgi:hypothetical protein
MGWAWMVSGSKWASGGVGRVTGCDGVKSKWVPFEG